MIFKIIGIITVFSAFSLMGIKFSFHLKERANQLNEICHSISRINEQINYSGKELNGILLNSFSNCNFITVSGNGIKISESSLNKDDTRLLYQYVNGLGLKEKKGEKERNQLFLSDFSGKKEEAEKEAKQKCKIYTVSGICIGLTAAVLFI